MATRPEPDPNRTGPQRGSGFREKGLRTGPDWTAATLVLTEVRPFLIIVDIVYIDKYLSICAHVHSLGT